MKVPAKLMREWYGKGGKLEKAGFEDIEVFDQDWEPEDTLKHSPATPNPEPIDLDEELVTDDRYRYFLKIREHTRELERSVRWLRDETHQLYWLLTLLYGEGESAKSIASFLEMSESGVIRIIRKLEKKLGLRK